MLTEMTGDESTWEPLSGSYSKHNLIPITLPLALSLTSDIFQGEYPPTIFTGGTAFSLTRLKHEGTVFPLTGVNNAGQADEANYIYVYICRHACIGIL
jgi:hypothetical protein